MTNGSHLDFLHKYNIYSYIKMNNILTFEDYKKMNIRQVESVIYHQFIEEEIKPEMNEGLIRNAINKASSKFIQNALADEIEKGKELEKSIREALDGLNKGFDEIEKKINGKRSKNSKLNNIEKVKEAIKAVQSQAFDTLTMIGSEGEIDFAGFMGSATVAAAANFGILFSPIRSLFITRKAYKYFLGIIKQTIRRNLLIIQLNFDQFENLILQKSFESEDDHEDRTIRETMIDAIGKLQVYLCKDNMFKTTKKKNDLSARINDFKKLYDTQLKMSKENSKSNPFRSLWQDQYNNTYTRTLEQIKQYVNDDSQKELDALKNSITKMAGNDVELGPYGELLISAAEEYAVHTNHGINNNFIKMSSVFNLENQKKLIELIVETQKENEEESKKKIEKQNLKKFKKDQENSIKEGKKLYEDNKDNFINPDNTYTFEEFEDKFSENDIKDLRAYFQTEEGQEDFKEIDEKNPLYKYFIDNDLISTNNFLNSINNLTLVEISDGEDFYKNKKIVEKDQSLYYIMAERSIRDAIKSKKSEEYFGIEGLDDNMIDKGKKTLTDTTTIDNILDNTINANPNAKKYFLTFDGDGDSLFKILHNDFKTEIFKKGGKYVSDISIESKKTLIKLIHKKFKIGNSISTKFAEYLVRLEAHMLLKNKNPWFVPKTNVDLKRCFDIDPKDNKIPNRHAFVEISSDDYDDIKNFLNNYHKLAENDFNIESEDNKTKKED